VGAECGVCAHGRGWVIHITSQSVKLTAGRNIIFRPDPESRSWTVVNDGTGAVCERVVCQLVREGGYLGTGGEDEFPNSMSSPGILRSRIPARAVTRVRLPFLGRVRHGVDMLTTCEGVNWGGRHGETVTIHQSNAINEANRDDHRFDLALKLETVPRLFRAWRL
jgi:hypothetical protein